MTNPPESTEAELIADLEASLAAGDLGLDLADKTSP
jgi:hypothetical protein